jgi:hypothetical protein
MAFIKNIEAKMKIALWIAIASMITSIIVSALAFSYSKKILTEERKHIYVLDKNIPLVAVSTNIEDNREVEYKADVETFHQLFSPCHRMINLLQANCKKQCISLMRLVLHSIIRLKKKDILLISLLQAALVPVLWIAFNLT